jgi:hypothetical protein
MFNIFIKGTAPTSWSVVDSCSQPRGPNNGLFRQCQHWGSFSIAMLTSAQQAKRKIVVSISDARAQHRLYCGMSKLEMLLPGDVDFHSTNAVEVLIVMSF